MKGREFSVNVQRMARHDSRKAQGVAMVVRKDLAEVGKNARDFAGSVDPACAKFTIG